MSMMEFSSESSVVDNLLAGELEATEAGTILSGETAALRGQLLGRVSRAVSATPPVVVGTGTGTMSAPTLGVSTKLGTYKVICTVAATNGGTFEVRDPDGSVVGGLATVGSAYTSAHVNFTITDGATDFIVGDYFLIVVTAGSGKYRKYNAANVDGSQYPSAILGEDADASAADVGGAAIYLAGQFKAAAVIGYTAALKDALRDVGIIIKQ